MVLKEFFFSLRPRFNRPMTPSSFVSLNSLLNVDLLSFKHQA